LRFFFNQAALRSAKKASIVASSIFYSYIT
jgi:hypothetical protein